MAKWCAIVNKMSGEIIHSSRDKLERSFGSYCDLLVPQNTGLSDKKVQPGSTFIAMQPCVLQRVVASQIYASSHFWWNCWCEWHFSAVYIAMVMTVVKIVAAVITFLNCKILCFCIWEAFKFTDYLFFNSHSIVNYVHTTNPETHMSLCMQM